MPIVREGPKDVDSRTLTIRKSPTLSTITMEPEDLYSQIGLLRVDKSTTMLAKRRGLLNSKYIHGHSQLAYGSSMKKE